MSSPAWDDAPTDASVPVMGRGAPASVPDATLAVSAAFDPRAFVAIYDRYGDRLYDFCAGMLRDRDAAADCVQDVFATAATRLTQLREPEKLRPWLYAIARHEALRRLRARDREQPVEALPESASDDEGPDSLAARTQLAELVAAAAGGLTDRDRAVLDLTYFQGLDGPELAAALGVSATNANTLVGRLRGTVERCLGALLLARRARAGHSGCPDLVVLVRDWDGQLTPLLRKRIARHVEGCTSCAGTRGELVNARALLGAVPPFLPAPLLLRSHTLATAVPHLATSVPNQGPWWPRRSDAGARRARYLAAASVAAAVVVAVAVAFWPTSGDVTPVAALLPPLSSPSPSPVMTTTTATTTSPVTGTTLTHAAAAPVRTRSSAPANRPVVPARPSPTTGTTPKTSCSPAPLAVSTCPGDADPGPCGGRTHKTCRSRPGPPPPQSCTPDPDADPPITCPDS